MGCEHNLCTCTLEAGDGYCSTYCRTQVEGGTTDGLCRCGHAECAGSSTEV